MADQIDQLADLFHRAEERRAHTDVQIANLTGALTMLAQRLEQDDPRPALTASAEAQQRLVERLRESGVDGIDAESRMRLRSIDVQLLKILEELSAGRQETMAEIRAEVGALARGLRQQRRQGE